MSVKDRLWHLVGFDNDEAIEEKRLANRAYLRLKARVEYLDHLRKVVLATEIERLRRDMTGRGVKTTEAMLENHARISVEYRAVLDKRVKLAEELADVEADYWALKDLIDSNRSVISFAKNEAAEVQ